VTTIDELVDAAIGDVLTETQQVDASSYLTAPITSSDLTLTVAAGDLFSRGIVEVGYELIVVDTVNRAAGTLVCGNVSGRGVQGTTAAAHSTGDRVVMAPSISRSRALRAVEHTLRASQGLFAVAYTDIEFASGQRAYTLPAGVRGVLDVAWLENIVSPSPGEWVSVRRWSHQRHQGTLVVGDRITPGLTVRVTYAADVTVPTYAQDFSTSGLPDSCMDVIQLGAAWRLASSLTPAAQLVRSAEAEGRQSGANPLQVARYFYGAYQERLAQEVRRLQELHPIRVHYKG